VRHFQGLAVPNIICTSWNETLPWE